MSLYTDLVDAGIEVSNHETDLYFPVTPESTEILERHPLQYSIRETFVNRVVGGRWYDIPFAYEPAWDRKLNK